MELIPHLLEVIHELLEFTLEWVVERLSDWLLNGLLDWLQIWFLSWLLSWLLVYRLDWFGSQLVLNIEVSHPLGLVTLWELGLLSLGLSLDHFVKVQRVNDSESGWKLPEEHEKDGGCHDASRALEELSDLLVGLVTPCGMSANGGCDEGQN